MATKQQIDDFKNTAPEVGEIRFLSNTSGNVTGLTISINDCGGSSRIESVSNLTNITIGSTDLTLINRDQRSGYFYYDVSPNVASSSLTAYEAVCTTTSLTPPPKIDTFRNSDYNVIFNNAIKIRRVQRTGSLGSNYSGIFEVDRKNDQIVPQNYDAIMSGSAATASFQESNIYSKTWTSARYDGTKIDSGSLFYNDPALSFKGFPAVRYKLKDSSSAIRSQSNTDTETFYFNPPYQLIRTGLRSYFQGSEIDTPPSTQPIYELVGKEFKRLTKSKLFLPNTEDIVRIEGYQAIYEANPANNPGASSGDNIFTVMIETLDTQDFYKYYNESGNLVGPFELRAGDGADVIKVSGSYIASLDSYALDIIDSGRTKAAIHNDGQNELTNVKTFFEVLSGSNNLV